MMRLRSALSVVLGALVVVTGLVPASPSEAAVRTRATLTMSTYHPIIGESFLAAGRLSTRFKRPVALRVRSGGSWKVVRRASVARTGVYRIRGLRTAVPRRYSVVVPAVRHGGHLYGSVVTRARLVRPVRQTAGVEVLPPVAQHGTGTAASSAASSSVVARFTPARPGRAVTFRYHSPGGAWRAAKATREGADGTAYFIGAVGSRVFKATAARRTGAAAASTGTATDTWGVATFDDEFSGTSLDTGTWAYRVGAAPSRTRSVNDADAVSVGGGTLRMHVTKPGALYHNGQITTKAILPPYGVFASRIRFPAQRGQHGSFWLQSDAYGAFPGDAARSGAEIDTVEFFGQGYPGGGLATFLYFVDGTGADVKTGAVWPLASRLVPAGDRWWNSYHVFSVRWTPTGYTFYVDGKVLSSTRRAVSHVSERIILSLLTSDWELPRFRLAKAGTMHVDWTKAWQPAG
jgi:beta-glucanase (GH16 family)